MATVSITGVDVGSTSIRAVEAIATRDKPIISNFGLAVLPEGAVVGGVVKDDRAVTAAVRQLWTGKNFKSNNVILGVTHQQVVVREVEVSNLPPKELKQALPFQVRDVVPLPLDQALIDFYPLEESPNKDTVRGLLIAAPKEAVINTVRAVERAGLHVSRVDLACFAALRSSAQASLDTEAVIDIGANGTNIIIHTDGVPQIVRTIPRGGVEVTRGLAQRLNMSFAEAEALKCRVGLIPGEGPETTEIVSDAIRPLIGEIRSSLNYYISANPTGRVARIALVGGAALLPGFVDELGRQLDMPVYLSDTLQRVTDSRSGGRHDVLGRHRSSAAVSIGLMLGAA
ncbi:MAG: type pilus assembly protein PilM [Pseudonocardiales bacterium]|nr:type pilus assembly protein PilM [Pseudonocardiales bacterium]